ncbi:MAG: STAS domain-containing protein [Candidatus Eremiobacterales bacterium]
MSTDIPRVAGLRLVDGIPVIEVFGEVDLTNRPALEGAINAAAEHDAGAVIVSLERASYFDSAIIHVILGARSRLRVNRQGLLIVGPAIEAGRRILEIAGLLDSKSSFETTDGALCAAKAMQADRGSV